jgi:hypothetical protein
MGQHGLFGSLVPLDSDRILVARRRRGVEQSAVQHRLKPAPQTLQLERVSRSELNLDPTVGGLLSGDGQCRLSHVNAQNRQSQRGDVKSVLAGPAARIEYRSGESAFGCQTHYCGLRLASIPRRRAVVVRRIPGQSRQPFVTGCVPTTERIVSEGSSSLRQLRPLLQVSCHLIVARQSTDYSSCWMCRHAKFRPLASHGTPLRHSKIPHRCDTRKQCRSGDHKRGRRRGF